MKNLIPIIRRKKKISQKAMAVALNISPSYLCKIENGIQSANDEFKKVCADYLKVTIDELFPLMPIKKTSKMVQKEFTNNLWSVRRYKGVKQNRLARQIGCSPSYLSKVEKGLQVPNDKFKKKCARILKIKEIELFP